MFVFFKLIRGAWFLIANEIIDKADLESSIFFVIEIGKLLQQVAGSPSSENHV